MQFAHVSQSPARLGWRMPCLSITCDDRLLADVLVLVATTASLPWRPSATSHVADVAGELGRVLPGTARGKPLVCAAPLAVATATKYAATSTADFGAGAAA